MINHPDARSPTAEAGFTLIEALTAMTVLAISAAALMGVAESHGGRVAALEERAAARWAAETVLAEIRAGARPPEDTTADVEMFGALVRVRVAVTPTDDRDILSVAVDARADTPRAPGARVEGFVLTGEPGR